MPRRIQEASVVTVPGRQPSSSVPSRLRPVLSGPYRQSLTLIPAIVAVSIAGIAISPAFLTRANIFDNIVAFSAPLGLLVIAESITVIGGYFDLSLQSTVGFTMVLYCYLEAGKTGANHGAGLSVAGAALVTVASALVIGAVNGLLVVTMKLNSFIVTLAMLILLQGLTLGISGGQDFTNIPSFVLYLGTGHLLGVPIEAVVFVVAFVLAGLFMAFTPTGRAIYALGGSEVAARAAGIKTRRISVGIFLFGSVAAMLGGVMLVGQVASATPALGNNMIFTVFAALVLGGVDLNGGRGTLAGAALGVVLLAVIQDILTLSSVSSFWINAAYGGIILAALIMNRLSSMKRRSRTTRLA
jgi:simple sugar transport system permease protein